MPPSKTRPSTLARRARNTAPLDASRAMLSLHGADQLLQPPGPDPGTYGVYDGSPYPSSFMAALKCKGKPSFQYNSKCCRFAPTRCETDLHTPIHGLPESPLKGHQPATTRCNVPLEWLKCSALKKRNLKNGKVRLGNFNEGAVSGTVKLPAQGEWQINFQVKTADIETTNSWSRHCADDVCEAYLNDKLVATVKNQPSQLFPIKAKITGNSFDFRFEFRSAIARFDNHMIVLDGVASCVSILPASHDAERQRRQLRSRQMQLTPITQKSRAGQTRPQTTGSGMQQIDSSTRLSAYGENDAARSQTAPWFPSSTEATTFESNLNEQNSLLSLCEILRQKQVHVQKMSGSSMVLAQDQLRRLPDWRVLRRQKEEHDAEVEAVKALDNFHEPKTRNIRFY